MPLFGSGTDKNALPAAAPSPKAPPSARPSVAPARPADALADYLFDQARDALHALHQHSYLPARDYQAIKALLDNVHLTPPPAPVDKSRSTKRDDDDDDEPDAEEIGKANAFMRKTLEDTSLLPSVVQMALTSAAPFLSDMQVDAIMEIVQDSQKSIARTVTDPSKQQMAKKGVVTASKATAKGAKTGLQASSRSVSSTAEKSKAQRQAKAQVKAEQQAVAAELAAERAWARKNVVEKSSSDHPTLAQSAEQAKHAERLASLEARDEALTAQVESQQEEDQDKVEEKGGARRVPPLPLGIQHRDTLSTLSPSSQSVGRATYAADSDALDKSYVEAQCIPLAQSSDDAAHSALTTTFSPWPGMILTQSLVVSSGTQSDVRLAQASHTSSHAQAQCPLTREMTAEFVESPTTTTNVSLSPAPTSVRSGSVASVTPLIPGGPPPPLIPAAPSGPPAYSAQPAPPRPPKPSSSNVPPPPFNTSYRSSQSAPTSALPPYPPPPAQPPSTGSTERNLPPAPAAVSPSGSRPASAGTSPAPQASSRSAVPRPTPPAPPAQDDTAPPPFGTVVDTTQTKRNKSGWSKLLG